MYKDGNDRRVAGERFSTLVPLHSTPSSILRCSLPPIELKSDIQRCRSSIEAPRDLVNRRFRIRRRKYENKLLTLRYWGAALLAAILLSATAMTSFAQQITGTPGSPGAQRKGAKAAHEKKLNLCNRGMVKEKFLKATE